LNQKDLKRYRKMLEDSKLGLLQIATKTLREEANFDSDDLPDEIDLASSEYAQSMIFRLRDHEKFLFKRIERALTRIEEGCRWPKLNPTANRPTSCPIDAMTFLARRCNRSGEWRDPSREHGS